MSVACRLNGLSTKMGTRGMVYWSLGQAFAVADMPIDQITTVSPANVIGGVFNYSGTAMKARHSVVAVSWNDPQDFYRPAIELVQNDAMVQLFGWRQDRKSTRLN